MSLNTVREGDGSDRVFPVELLGVDQCPSMEWGPWDAGFPKLTDRETLL